MAGWRIGFAVGNKTLIEALTKIKSYVDYGAFTPVQVAATAALNGSQRCVEEIRETYKKRRDVLIESLSCICHLPPKDNAPITLVIKTL